MFNCAKPRSAASKALSSLRRVGGRSHPFLEYPGSPDTCLRVLLVVRLPGELVHFIDQRRRSRGLPSGERDRVGDVIERHHVHDHALQRRQRTRHVGVRAARSNRVQRRRRHQRRHRRQRGPRQQLATEPDRPAGDGAGPAKAPPHLRALARLLGSRKPNARCWTWSRIGVNRRISLGIEV